MKNLIITATLLFSVVSISVAQKFAYLDTQYILLHVPEYADAQAELNDYASDWQEEIEEKYNSIQRLEEAFGAEKILLTVQMKQKRQDDINNMKQQAMQMQKQKFGVEGELFKKREELIMPIQDDIYEAIKDVASSRGYMVVFDKAKQNNMLYTNPKYDVSDQVIKKLGFKPGETIEQPEKDVNQPKGNIDKGSSTSKGLDAGRSGSTVSPKGVRNKK